MRFEKRDKISICHNQPVIIMSLEEKNKFVEMLNFVIDTSGDESDSCNACCFSSLCDEFSTPCEAALTLKNVLLSDMISTEI